jgi:hypothetical protein
MIVGLNIEAKAAKDVKALLVNEFLDAATGAATARLSFTGKRQVFTRGNL